jgi:hypothetical protein
MNEVFKAFSREETDRCFFLHYYGNTNILKIDFSLILPKNYLPDISNFCAYSFGILLYQRIIVLSSFFWIVFVSNVHNVLTNYASV